jgi:hypothetical protein
MVSEGEQDTEDGHDAVEYCGISMNVNVLKVGLAASSGAKKTEKSNRSCSRWT